MEKATRREARPACKPRARHTTERGSNSLTPAARDMVFGVVMLFLMLGIVWGVSAMYQKGYVEGYEQAKAAYNG